MSITINKGSKMKLVIVCLVMVLLGCTEKELKSFESQFNMRTKIIQDGFKSKPRKSRNLFKKVDTTPKTIPLYLTSEQCLKLAKQYAAKGKYEKAGDIMKSASYLVWDEHNETELYDAYDNCDWFLGEAYKYYKKGGATHKAKSIYTSIGEVDTFRQYGDGTNMVYIGKTKRL